MKVRKAIGTPSTMLWRAVTKKLKPALTTLKIRRVKSLPNRSLMRALVNCPRISRTLMYSLQTSHRMCRKTSSKCTLLSSCRTILIYSNRMINSQVTMIQWIWAVSLDPVRKLSNRIRRNIWLLFLT